VTGTASVAIEGGAYTVEYTADAATSFGAKVYCHMVHGAELADVG
jgi:hypothetical protein